MELLVVVVIISILAGLLLGALKNARSQADAAACLSNLRQLGMAFHMYADANADRFPYPNANYNGLGDDSDDVLCWFNALDPYLLSLTAATNKASEHLHLVKQDPIIKRLGTNWLANAHTFKMNEWMGQKDGGGAKYFWCLGELQNSSITVLVFDGKAEKSADPNDPPANQTEGTEGDVMRRHANQANVLFVDGHASLRDEKHQTTGDGLGWKVNETRLLWKPWTNLVSN